MDKNTVKKLANNPHYTMSPKEVEELEKLLHEEAEKQKKEEAPKARGINKNRVRKNRTKLRKSKPLQEDKDAS